MGVTRPDLWSIDAIVKRRSGLVWSGLVCRDVMMEDRDLRTKIGGQRMEARCWRTKNRGHSLEDIE